MAVAVEATPKSPSASLPNSASLPYVPPVQKPDEVHYHTLIKVQTEAISALRQKIGELSDKIAEHSSGREGYQKQRDECRARIQELTTRIDALNEERKAMQDRILSSQSTGKNLRTQVEALQKNIGFRTVEEIDRRLAEIELEHMTSSLTLKEEKKLLADMEKLRKSKPELAKVAELQARAAHMDTVVASVNQGDRQLEIRDQLAQLRTAKEDELAKIAALDAEREKVMAPLRHLIDERDELRRKMADHSAIQNKLESELRTKDTEYRAYLGKIRNQRLELERHGRALDKIEADKKLVQSELAALQSGVFDWKATLARQLKAYLEAEVKAYEKASAGGSSRDAGETLPSNTQVETEEGTFIAHTRERDELFQVGNGSKKKKNGKKATKENKVVPLAMQHSMATIRDFVSIGLDRDLPRLVTDCPKVITKLDLMIEQQKIKSAALEEVVTTKKAELEKKLSAIELQEKELEARAPPGFRRVKKVEGAE